MEAFRQLEDKNANLTREYGIGDGKGRYDYDIPNGVLSFSPEGGGPSVLADIQVVGTTSESSRNWLWAWANAHFPEESTEDSSRTRDFGEKYGICELTHDYVWALEDGVVNVLGWELAAAAVRVCNAVGAYKPPSKGGGALFLLIRSISLVE